MYFYLDSTVFNCSQYQKTNFLSNFSEDWCLQINIKTVNWQEHIIKIVTFCTLHFWKLWQKGLFSFNFFNCECCWIDLFFVCFVSDIAPNRKQSIFDWHQYEQISWTNLKIENISVLNLYLKLYNYRICVMSSCSS